MKGTCHICHDAAGARPTGEALLQRAIPPLAILVADNLPVTFISLCSLGRLAEVGGGRISPICGRILRSRHDR